MYLTLPLQNLNILFKWPHNLILYSIRDAERLNGTPRIKQAVILTFNMFPVLYIEKIRVFSPSSCNYPLPSDLAEVYYGRLLVGFNYPL